ncbi:hypothetical protein L1987_35673 [Smallanthus sonchifolius]|uniref:Uncharacterized protein n=1 Tax=Smallanthus sonchifolius TaxID=185202 RepID=A0ACB9HCS4_9ASTR|nr:hypothetical protein L1987_35673 [Smallanthus sonchifolius]
MLRVICMPTGSRMVIRYGICMVNDVGQCSNPVPSQHVGQDTDDEDLGEYSGYDQMVMESMHQNHHPYYHQGEQDPNQTAETFYTMLRQANEPLWDGSDASTLSATRLLNWKSDCISYTYV